jgi:chemotaxis protein histidine kinase CheA
MDRARAEELYKRYQTGEHKDNAYVASLANALNAKDKCEPSYLEFFDVYYDEACMFVNRMSTYIAEFRQGVFTPESISESFRLSHLVKGASATMGYGIISTMSSGLESLFSEMKAGTRTLTPDLIDLVDETMRLIAEHLEELKQSVK